MMLIPAIDLAAGRCVRLYQGDFAAETHYPIDPLDLLRRYRNTGAAWLHVVDLDGARDGHQGNYPIVAALAARQQLALQVGGGLRERAALEQLLALGVSRCVVGSAAVTRVDQVRDWLRGFGPERIVLAFDVRLDTGGVPRVATHGWREQRELSLWDAVATYTDLGLRHVLCTDVARDGTLGGPNVPLYREAVQRFPGIAWQASGGIRDAADLGALAATGAAAAISGRALLEDRIPVEELRPFLPNA